MRTYPIIDGHAYVIDDDYRELRIFAPDLEAEIPYILKENIKVLSIDTLDPVALHKYFARWRATASICCPFGLQTD